VGWSRFPQWGRGSGYTRSAWPAVYAVLQLGHRLERTMCRDRKPGLPGDDGYLHGNCRSGNSRGGGWHRMAVNLLSRRAS
jgi:hypothetical protein